MKSPKIQSRLYAGGSQVKHEPGSVDRPAIQPRAYQLEMFEETLKRNTIICMSTGSGKTQIAKLRIEAELKRSPTKIVWFMAPSVALSQQQHSYLSRQLPAHQFRIITSLDNVEHWSTQAIWDAALSNMEVIVSTPQPLLDALSHGFIHMRRLSLLVFDEAHHCTKNAPMNKILQTFYHPVKQEGLVSELPRILGLSASPITSSKSTLESLERNMDAVCTTPTRQIDEYRQFVREPEFVALPFMAPGPGPPLLVLSRLRQTIASLDINDDPYVQFLRKSGSKRSQEKLSEALETRGTPSFKQLQALDRRAHDLYCELGEAACTRFVAECVTRLHNSEADINRLVPTLANQERKYLDTVLSQTRSEAISLLECKPPPSQISAKAGVLFKLLLEEFTLGMRCVIFVKQRSTAWALSQLINIHPEFQGKYSAEPFVGLTRADRNIQLVDLVKMRNPSEVLANFESGKVNIVVATSVMEEGVDIPATNLVVRFDDSENFRSFVQSRGRARHPHSKFVTLLEGGYDGRPYMSWKALEIEMKAKYADEHRKMAEIEKEEEEEEEEGRQKTFCVPSTNATLTLDSAIQHLEHFCSKLPKVAYMDEPRPEFVLTRIPDVGVSAKVVLPASVDPEIRQFSGSPCRTERLAKKDAVFEAYRGLYHAGLVNDNLLPAVVPETEDAISAQIERREGVCQTENRLDPWREIATTCNLQDANLFTFRLDISGEEWPISPVLLVLPKALHTSLQIPLLWTPSSTFTALVTPYTDGLPASFQFGAAQQATHHLLKTIFSRKMQHQDLPPDGYPCMLVPADYVGALKEWLDDPLGMMSEDDKTSLESHLVRRSNSNIPYFFRKATTPSSLNGQVENETQHQFGEGNAGYSGESSEEETSSEDSDTVDLMRLPKRVDFLHPNTSEGAHTAWESIPWSECSIENLPASYGRTMLFIPSILHIVEIALVSQIALDTLLSPIGFRDPNLVMTALTAPAAQEYVNYQVLEFLGDSLLKYYTSLNLFVQFPKWHEGYLASKKDSIVSNARLCRAALDAGLDRFIHTEPFAGAQWKVRTVSDLRSEPKDPPKRCLSTKVLADVVEALIGAAYMDGNDSQESERQSLACMKLFLPELAWDTVQGNIARCHYPQLPEDVSVSHFATVEAMIGYQFQNHMLIAEALTHPSAMHGFGSYQRLEYLGDAVLDHIVVATVFRAGHKTRSPLSMTLIRAAVVNADFLAFLCLETTIELDRFDVSTDNLTHDSTVKQGSERKILCQFLSTAESAIMLAQQACIERHQQLRDQISEAIQHGTSYPWSLLIRLGADKFLSDIIESILGAIYIDSRGSIAACEDFLGRIGLLSYLQRLISEPEIEVMHPKERLGIDSGNAKLTYESPIEYGDDGQARYIGRVVKDGEVFAVSDPGYSRKEVETRAAELAIAKLAVGKEL